MLFSATMPEEIRRLAKDLLTDPLQITLSIAKPADGITQQAYICYEKQKLGIINDIFNSESSERVILFASRKSKVKEISLTLKRHGFNVGEMHSDLSQSERDEIMFRYKSRKIDMIVATDILARGIDIDDIRIVINYDVPRDHDDYIHRIGRTARAGTKGRAITFVSEEDQEYFKRIEDFIEQEVPKMELPQALGEAPAYEPNKKREDSKRRNNRKGGKESAGKRKRAPRNEKKRKENTTATEKTPADKEKRKGSYRHRRHRTNGKKERERQKP